MMKYAVIVLVAALAGAGYWYTQQKGSTSPTPAAMKASTALAPEVERILSVKSTLLIALAANPVIVQAVKQANTSSAALSMAKIQELDAQWQGAESVTPFISQFMTNTTAKQLLEFQKQHPEFKEVFAADSVGLNVGQTDKTSDYYQGDEAWWKDSMNNGKGAVLHGDIEFDESSQTEAISLYVPVMDGARAIGVIKGVADLSAISGEL